MSGFLSARPDMSKTRRERVVPIDQTKPKGGVLVGDFSGQQVVSSRKVENPPITLTLITGVA
jgi:hypothetical protein